MKHKINQLLRKFGAEIHGIGYLEKLRNADPKKSEWKKQQEIIGNDCHVVFDVGANRGLTSAAYTAVFPNATIHAFEPFPETCHAFRTNLGNNPFIRLNEVAVSDKEGVASLHVNTSVDTNSLLESQALGVSSDKSCQTQTAIEVPTITLDSYCKSHSIEKIDILKIDVQGAEIKVLQGAKELLQQGRIRLIYTETYFQQQYVNQPLFHEIAAELYPYGFVLQDIYDPYYSQETILWSDSLFVHRSLL
jgi:FkbM family methyltransferase